MTTQASLFEDGSGGPGESLDAVNREIRERGEAAFPSKTFILGAGPADADVAVVGESPGPPDVLSGVPFNGPAGDLRRKILSAIDIDFDKTYRTNAVKFVSQGDEITPEVLSFFSPYLKRELLAVSPRIVITLGNTPTKALLDTKQPISKVRGELARFDGLTVMPTFNPAYLLRDPTKKREVWQDMKKVVEFLKVTSPKDRSF
jgi:DNA polymerase